MTTLQASTLAGATLVIGALSGWFLPVVGARSAISALSKRNASAGLSLLNAVFGRLQLPGDSPVVVVGGSITARAPSAWASPACAQDGSTSGFGVKDQYNTCTFSVTARTDQIAVIGAIASKPNEPLSLAGLNVDWTIEIFGTDKTFNTVGIRVCTQMDCSLNSTPSTGKVYLTPEPSNSAFYANNVATPNDERFYDTKRCKSVSGDDPDFCEGIDHIVLTVALPTAAAPTAYAYACPDRDCRIEIGPPQ
jgi:hypothetical protein